MFENRCNNKTTIPSQMPRCRIFWGERKGSGWMPIRLDLIMLGTDMCFYEVI